MDRWMDSKHPVNPDISVQNQNKLLDLSCLFRPSYSQFKNFHCLRFTGLSSSHNIQNHPGVQGRLRPIPVTVWTLEISFRCLRCNRTLPRLLCPLVLTFFLARDQSSHRIMLQIVTHLQAMGKTHCHTLRLPIWHESKHTEADNHIPFHFRSVSVFFRDLERQLTELWSGHQQLRLMGNHRVLGHFNKKKRNTTTVSCRRIYHNKAPQDSVCYIST